MAAENTNTTSVALSYTLEVDSVSSKQNVGEFMLMTSLKAPTYQSNKRAPLDLIAVVDRSGSMAGTKLDLVKQTLHFVETQLTDVDRLGIVAYDNTVTTPLPLTNMTSAGKSKANAAISAISSGGSTNLCGGLLQAVEEMRHRTTKNEVASVLLFTDGHANVGPTDDKGIIYAVTHPRSAPLAAGRMPNAQYKPISPRNMQNVQMPNVQYNQIPLQQNNMQMPNVAYGQMPNFQNQVQQMPPVQQMPILQNQVQQMPQMTQQRMQQVPTQKPIVQQPVQQMQNIVEEMDDVPIPATSDPAYELIPCTINTFGYGTDHSATVLKGIADSGSGIYYFIENPDTIPESFADCLGGLLSVAAQNISLKFEAVGQVKIKRVAVGKFKLNEVRAGREYELTIGDIQSDEQRDIIIHLELPQLEQPEESFSLLKITLNYLNVISTSLEESSIVAVVKRPEVAADKKINLELDKQRNRLLAAEAMEKATVAGNNNNLDQARQILKACITRIEESVSVQDTFSQGLIVDLKQCETTLQDRHTFEKQGQQMLMNNSSAHYNQRSSNVKMVSQQAYQTPSRGFQQMQQQQQFQ